MEFSDFQCPFCRVAAARIDSVRKENPDHVQVVFRHFPLPNHEHATTAARATECADEQGAFWEMHDQLFANQDSLGRLAWDDLASLAGVKDLGAFRSCIIRSVASPALVRDTLAGKLLGVRATPTILINETRFTGAPPLDTLRAHVRRIIATHRGD